MARSRQLFLFFTTALIGLGSGLAGVGLQYGMSWIFQLGIVSASRLSFWLFAVCAVLVMVIGAAIVGWWMQQYAPEAQGSGVPQVKAAYSNRKLDFSWNLIWVKFFGGMLAIGSGSSLGREGPTIHIGAALASKISRFGKESDEAKANALCAGSAAGLAAAFNSPIAAVTMIFEVITDSRDMEKYANRCLIASALAVSMIYLLTGDAAALPIKEEIPMKWSVFWLSPLVALFAGLLGIFFQWATLGVRARFKMSKLPLWMRPAMGALIGSIFCIMAFGLTSKLGAFGLGEHDLYAALQNQIYWNAACWLLLGKLFASIFCFGSGGCGGIFSPLIFFGAMAGLIVHGLTGTWLNLQDGDQTLLSLIGMTACLGAVVRAPLTSILIVVEMTRQLHVLPALMVAAVIGVFINTIFYRNNFYNEILHEDGIQLKHRPI